MTDTTRRARLDDAFLREERTALRLAAWFRTLGGLVVTVWIGVENSFPASLHPQAAALLFVAFGWLHVVCERRGLLARRRRYLFPALDVLLVIMATAVPNPLERSFFPIQLELRFGNEIYLFVVLAASVFSFSPAVIMWTAAFAAAAWSAVTLLILALPSSLGMIPGDVYANAPPDELLAMVLDPHRIWVGPWGRQVVLLLVTGGALAAFVWRARQLVDRQTDAEWERANLSRYFSPNLVDELSHAGEPLASTRELQSAVLFADMAGFTPLSERLPAEQVIDLLRDLHGRLARAVFAHHGTLDKFLGDGIMATFGTPQTGRRDASNAVLAARAMIAAVDAWNVERTARAAPPVRIGIGVHYGPVVLGDIGDEQRLEFAVVGDTVNVASRLERLTRSLPTAIVLSRALVDAVRREATGAEVLDGFGDAGTQPLPGRAEPIEVWTLQAQPEP